MRDRVWPGFRKILFGMGPRGLFLRQFLLGEAVLLALLLAITAFVLVRNDGIMRDEIGTILEGTLRRTRDSMDAIFEQADWIAAAISLHSDVDAFLGIPAADAAGLDAQGWLVSRLIGGYALTVPYVSSIYLYSERSGRIVSTNINLPLERFNDTGWMGRYRASPLNVPGTTVRRAIVPYGDVISVIRPIGLVYNPRIDGAVIVNMKVDRIDEKVGGGGVVGDLCILDSDGAIIYSRERSLLGTRIGLPPDPRSTFPSIRNAPRGSWLSRSIEGRSDRTYLMAFPLAQFRRRQRTALSIALILAVITVPLSLAASMLLSWAGARPLWQILHLLERPETGAVPAATSEEVRSIASRIVTTINANKDLHDEMARQLSLLDRTRNVALQAQINPHFLFNTLETIRWEAVALSDGENKVSRMIGGLSRMLRVSLEELRRGIAEASRSLDADHIGVRNVAQRMRLVFGDGFGLSIDSTVGGGTVVALVFPVIPPLP